MSDISYSPEDYQALFVDTSRVCRDCGQRDGRVERGTYRCFNCEAYQHALEREARHGARDATAGWSPAEYD